MLRLLIVLRKYDDYDNYDGKNTNDWHDDAHDYDDVISKDDDGNGDVDYDYGVDDQSGEDDEVISIDDDDDNNTHYDKAPSLVPIPPQEAPSTLPYPDSTYQDSTLRAEPTLVATRRVHLWLKATAALPGGTSPASTWPLPNPTPHPPTCSFQAATSHPVAAKP